MTHDWTYLASHETTAGTWLYGMDASCSSSHDEDILYRQPTPTPSTSTPASTLSSRSGSFSSLNDMRQPTRPALSRTRNISEASSMSRLSSSSSLSTLDTSYTPLFSPRASSVSSECSSICEDDTPSPSADADPKSLKSRPSAATDRPDATEALSACETLATSRSSLAAQSATTAHITTRNPFLAYENDWEKYLTSRDPGPNHWLFNGARSPSS